MNAMSWPILVSLISVSLLVVAETRHIRAAVWVFKPIASSCFLWLAWLAGAADSSYGQWLLAALVFCMLGDIFLIPKRDTTFLAGLASFLLGHLLFAVTFLQLGTRALAIACAAVPAVTLGVLALRWLNPHLAGNMRAAVICYVLVICTMLTCAGTSLGHPVAPWILVGAWGFAISDLAVAREQFIHSSALNRCWGLPLYFGSQMVLAWTPALLN